ncbi:MAG TPA: hypothetical protein VFX35_06340 [Solirubrobacterales bacterium]|nr:hypothetical protein [Solirubrobacterales bacterium]
MQEISGGFFESSVADSFTRSTAWSLLHELDGPDQTNPGLSSGEGVRKKMRSRPSPLHFFPAAFGAALAVSLIIAALAASSASALSFAPNKGLFPALFTSKAGLAEIRVLNEGPHSCSGATSSGKFVNGTSGEIKLTYTGCVFRPFGGSGTPCTSPGQASGTIVTTNLSFTLVYLDAAHTKYGLLLSPPGAGGLVPPVFAEAECAGWGKEKWLGELMGQIISPALGAPMSTAFKFYFNAVGATQEPRFVEGTGPAHRLFREAVWTGSELREMGIVQEHSASLANAGQFLP